MVDIADLTNLFGESWCVTVTDMPLAATLEFMGVVDPIIMPDGMARMTARLISGASQSDRRTLLLGATAARGHSVIMELESLIGWVGEDSSLLTELSEGNGVACAAVSNPSRLAVNIAENGRISGIEPIAGRRWGQPSRRLAAALSEAGFPVDAMDDDAVGEASTASFAQCALLAVRAATGITLRPEFFQTAWFGGLTYPR